MIIEILILLLYIGVFAVFFRFRSVIKVMTDINDTFADLMSDTPEIDKREFLIEKVKHGESISNSKTIWTEKRLQETSDKVIDKLYEK